MRNCCASSFCLRPRPSLHNVKTMTRTLLIAGFTSFLAATAVFSQTTDANINTLTDQEKADGWQLLFDGQDLNGWHNFKMEGVRPGWQVKDGALVCADPHNAGDIVTSNQFE